MLQKGSLGEDRLRVFTEASKHGGMFIMWQGKDSVNCLNDNAGQLFFFVTLYFNAIAIQQFIEVCKASGRDVPDELMNLQL